MKRNIITFFLLFLVLNDFAFSNWKKIFEKGQYSIYSKTNYQRIIPFKAKAVLDIDINRIFNVLMDYQNKSKWSPKLKRVKVHETLSENEFIFSEYYKTPWPASDREFLLKGKVLWTTKNKFIMRASSYENVNYASDDHVQADVRKLEFIADRNAQGGTDISFEFEGDLKGWMPAWLVNIIQRKWPYRFLTELEKYSRINSVQN